MKYRTTVAGLALLLAGCAAGAGGWTKAGADTGAVAAAYSDCKAMADTAVQTESGINQDILATRGGDWGRAGIGRVETAAMGEHIGKRSGNIVDACMKAKGFSPTP